MLGQNFLLYEGKVDKRHETTNSLNEYKNKMKVLRI